MVLPGKVLAGLFICSNGKNAVEEVRVWNVRIDKPVSNDYNPGKDGWLGCRLETMNVFNMDGALYKIPIPYSTKKPDI